MPTGIYTRTEYHKNILKANQKKASLAAIGKSRPDMLGDKNPAKRIEIKEKISKALKGKKYPYRPHPKAVGRIVWNKGKPWDEEIKQKMSRVHFGKKLPERSKEKHWNWKGGISEESYNIDWTKTLRRSIRERDKYTCQICKIPQEDYAFSIHHIDYNKENCNPNNLITLCKSCHTKTNFNRPYWIKYFKEKLYVI
jgi:hypothetical protein